ncbi:MAG: hypothetical protein ABIT71_06340, partial [Vicinamibacteraceae bacterium]
MNATLTTTATPPFADSVLRLVRFDLRRFRVLVLLMVGLELARAALVEWTLHGLPTTIGERFGGTFGVAEMPIADLVLGVVALLVTGLVIQADDPSDDRAFWRTRPIAPLALAVAKAITCALLLVVVPWVVNAG